MTLSIIDVFWHLTTCLGDCERLHALLPLQLKYNDLNDLVILFSAKVLMYVCSSFHNQWEEPLKRGLNFEIVKDWMTVKMIYDASPSRSFLKHWP